MRASGKNITSLVQDLSLLLCAAAGPLEIEAAESLFPELLRHPLCTVRDDLVQVNTQPDFPLLYAAAASCRGLKPALRKLEQWRSNRVNGREAMPTREKRLIFGAARRALLQQDTHAFNEVWEQFLRLNKGDLSGTKTAAHFWSEVLGRQWEGHSFVPQGAARNSLVSLLGLRYVLLPYTGKEALPIEEMPLMLRLAAHLAAGNRCAIEDIRPEEDADEHTARAACLQMLDGEWDMACASFIECFRPRSVLIYRVLHTCAAPLLAFALLCTIRNSPRNSPTELWVDILQRLLPEALPGAEEESVIAFIHNLQVAIDVLCRGKLPRYVPDVSGTIAGLPLALCYQGLNAALRAKITAKRMTEVVGHALQYGPILSAYYAAQALKTAGVSLPRTWAAKMKQLHQAGVAPMYTDFPDLDVQEVISPQHIRDSLRRAQAQAQQEDSLGWDLVLDRDTQTVTSLRPILYSPGQGNVWLTRDLSKCRISVRVEQDLAGLSMLGDTDGEGVAPDWIAALAGHPRLRIVMPGKRTTAITLRAENPRVRITREGGFITLTPENTDYRKLRAISATEWGALRHSQGLENLRKLVCTYGEGGKLRFKEKDASELYRTLSEWTDEFDYIGSLSENREPQEEVCRLVASVSVSPKEVGIRLGIRVLPGSERTFTPGEGARQVDVQTSAGIFPVQRDFRKEKACLETVLEQCPGLNVDGGLSMVSDDIPKSLELLSQLESSGVSLFRDGQERMHCFTPADTYLTLKTRSIGSEWFDIGGELTVDENLTIPLRELLESLDARIGVFLPVRKGYIRMPEKLEKQLTLLHSLMSVRGQTPGLSAAAILAMSHALGNENLPPALRNRLSGAAHAADLDAPAELHAVLRPYQLIGFRWLAERASIGIGACLADDMGLGKTVQLIALLLHLAAKGPSLLVSPLSLQSNWERELARFAPSLRVLPFSPNRPWHVPEAGEVVIVSYGQLPNNLRQFSSVPWNVLALDEAQAIKNPDSQRAKAVCALSAFARVCLTGTPVENSEMDLWSIMRFLNPLLFGTKASFRRRFLAKKQGGCPLQDLVSTLVLRRSKTEVLTELPELIEQVLPVELNDEERAIYEAIRRRTIEKLESENNRISVLSELMRLRRACCHGHLVIDDYTGESSKLKLLLHVLEELRNTGHKALVFSQFTDVLDLAETLLKNEKFRLERLDGTRTSRQRTQAIDRFHRGEADVFLISLKAGGTGLNLTEADYVILLDPWWNPAAEAQAASRSHRMGQRHPVSVYRLIATHTVEEKILRLHETKKQLAQDLLDGATLPIEELKLLLNE